MSEEKKEENVKKPFLSRSAKKFAILGATTILTLYGAQAVGVASYNSMSQSTHEFEMVSVYNNIWKNIDRKDVSLEIAQYKKLANDVPSELKVGLLKPEDTGIKMSITSLLPSAQDVEEKAIALSKKTQIRHR